ncbi:hypothetical protein ACJMK2_020892 [Sinanodonta woodiana]|uniref:Transmembrane protein n=1 Tax=Sinanodonta woodiana TaxID=1069815 RepID=A0ABD3U2T3_SINWO
MQIRVVSNWVYSIFRIISIRTKPAEYSFFKGRREEEKKDKSENQPTYPFQKLCSLETTFICTQCSVQSTSKYIPKELASMDGVVHVETIKNIKRDLLDAPRIKCHQKCSWFCLGLLFFYVVTCIFIVLFDIILIIICTRVKNSRDENCIGLISIYVLCEIALGICVGVGFKYYYKVPRSIDQKIAEYNSELIKNGILITLVCTRKWRKASIVFYKASVDTCKQYIICHLRGVKKTERETLVNISETEAQTCADDIPILTRSGNEDLVQDTQTHHCGHDTLVDTSEMQENQIADDVPLLDLADNDQLDQLTEPLHRGHHMRLEKETVVNTSEMQENHIAEDLPLLNLSEQDQLDQSTENEAMKLLLMNAHEYLRQVFNGKMKNPKEDRHIPDCTCLSIQGDMGPVSNSDIRRK